MDRGDRLGLYATTTSITDLSPTPNVFATLRYNYSNHGIRAFNYEQKGRETRNKGKQQMSCTQPSHN